MSARERRDPEPGQPSLELPSLSDWRRKRRARSASTAEPAADQRTGGAQATEPDPPTVAPTPPAAVAPEPTPEPEPAQPAPPPAPTPAADQPPGGAQATEPDPPTVAPTPPAAVAPEPEAEPEPESEDTDRRAPRVRRPGGLPTVVVIGALVGLAVVGLTWAALQACRQVEGTPSCGTAGYPLLALVLALSIVVGVMLLRLALVPDPVSTSLLGVGLAAVIVMLTLVGHLEQPAMVVVVPVISALTFAAAHWISAAAVEPDDR